MKYKIRDLQFACRYFADEAIFNSKREACEQLISYHDIDCDMSVYQKLLDAGKVDECWDQLTYFEWELEPVQEPPTDDELRSMRADDDYQAMKEGEL